MVSHAHGDGGGEDEDEGGGGSAILRVYTGRGGRVSQTNLNFQAHWPSSHSPVGNSPGSHW